MMTGQTGMMMRFTLKQVEDQYIKRALYSDQDNHDNHAIKFAGVFMDIVEPGEVEGTSGRKRRAAAAGVSGSWFL